MSTEPVVFWDFDGTLAERDGMWPEVLREAILRADPSTAVSLIDLAAGLQTGFPHYGPNELRVYPNAPAWWAAVSHTLLDACTGAGVNTSLAERAVALVPRVYYQPASWNVVSGAFSALRMTSRAGFRNVILSNHAPELPELVVALGLSPLVERTLTSAGLGLEKPDPKIFETAHRITGAAPDSWMIGDNPTTDVEGARRAGMRAVLVHRATDDSPPRTLRSAAAKIVRA